MTSVAGRSGPLRRGVAAWLAATWVLAIAAGGSRGQDRGRAWQRHTIDASSRGADGVRLADINGDGLPDITTGWEEGGLVRVYVNPGAKRARDRWPAVTVGRVRSPEDAVFADVDGDGATDVVSCCEGKTMCVFVHWAPKDPKARLDAGAWSTQAVPAAQGVTRWMFCVPMQVDGRHGVDLVVGSKNPNGQVAWLQAPADPRDLAAWKRHVICPAGWIMSLIAADVDADGDQDVVVSDRKGPRRGCFWLENPGPGGGQDKPWPRHPIGAAGREVMFVALADLDGDGLSDVLAATKPHELLFLRQKARGGRSWQSWAIRKPPNTGTLKAPGVGDLDRDGKLDIVFTCENAHKAMSGVVWLSRTNGVTSPNWQAHELSGPQGVKYDLVELLDLDGDGDLDVLTCEERANLGVVWYENPWQRTAKKT